MDAQLVEKNKWIIENNKVTVYPFGQKRMQMMAVSIFLFLVAGPILVLVQPNVSFTFWIVCVLVFVIIVGFPIVYGIIKSRKKVVIDGNTQSVYVQKNGDQKHLADFSDIHAISLRNLGMFSAPAYSITLKDDKLGQGIIISRIIIAKKGKPENDYEATVLPKIKEIVYSAQKKFINEHRIESAVKDMVVLKQFKYDGQHSYTYYPPVRYLNFAIGLLFFGVLCYFLQLFLATDFQTATNNEDKWGVLFGILIFGFYFLYVAYKSSQKIIMDSATGEIIESNLFGLFRRRFDIADFEKFHSTKHYVNGLYTSTDLKMQFDKKRKIKIAQRRNVKKVSGLMDEVNYIISLMQKKKYANASLN